MKEMNRLNDNAEKASCGFTQRSGAESEKPVKAKASSEIYLRSCRGPLGDGSCRMPEETCNHPTCPARG